MAKINSIRIMAIIEQFVSIEILEDRYNSCPEPEYPSLYPNAQEVRQGKRNQLSKKKNEIAKAYQEWYEDIQFYEGRKLNDEEYTKEINSIKEIIRFIDKKMDPDRFFQNGPDDTKLCKQYLQRMKNKLWDEDKEDLKCMFHAWQWLLRKKAEDFKELKPVEEEENSTLIGNTEGEDEELLKVLTAFEIGVQSHAIILDEGTIPDKYILVAIMYMYQEEKKPWACNANQLAGKVVSVLPETKNLSEEKKTNMTKTIYRRLHRAINNEMGNLRPKDLDLERIIRKTGVKKEEADNVIDKYKAASNAVLQCRDNIREE